AIFRSPDDGQRHRYFGAIEQLCLRGLEAGHLAINPPHRLARAFAEKLVEAVLSELFHQIAVHAVEGGSELFRRGFALSVHVEGKVADSAEQIGGVSMLHLHSPSEARRPTPRWPAPAGRRRVG